MTRLEQFGWRGESAASGIARVVSAHGDYYHLVCNEAAGEILARRKKSAFAGKATKARLVAGKAANVETRTRGAADLPRPITGDFVRFRYNAQGESMITALLPRFSHFERKDPTARRTSQTLAVNFDTLFIMMSLNEDFSTARIDRYLTLAEDIGEAEVVVVVTKVDLREDGDEEFLDELRVTVAGRADPRDLVPDGRRARRRARLRAAGADARLHRLVGRRQVDLAQHACGRRVGGDAGDPGMEREGAAHDDVARAGAPAVGRNGHRHARHPRNRHSRRGGDGPGEGRRHAPLPQITGRPQFLVFAVASRHKIWYTSPHL